MPPRREPFTLKSLALRAVTLSVKREVHIIMSMSAQRHDRRLRWLHDHVLSVPDSLSGGVVGAALKSADLFLGYRNNHPARRVLDKLLAVLVPVTSRRLVLPVAESYPLREALLRRVRALPHLQELTLSESLHFHMSVDLVVSALCELRHLRIVRAPWLCSDDMAASLALSCPALEALDASESRLTDRGVSALARDCLRLHTLMLTGCRVSGSGYQQLLVGGLRRVGRCPSLGGVVRAAATPLALTEWDSDHAPSPAEAALCPSVTAVALSDVTVLPCEDGALLPDAVRILRVSWVGLRDHAVRLKLRLPVAVTHLDMMDHAVTLADAIELGRQCPALRVLKLAMLEHVPAAVVPTHPGRDAPFRRLEDFHLYSGTGPLLEYVLLHATALRRLSVTPALDESHAWTDDTMRRIVGVNPLAELESFSLACSCELTMATVYLLVLGCPKLRALFDLREWLVTDTERCELMELAAINNWDLELGLP